MNITDKNTLKSWFLRGMKPLESQFAAWIDAYWHKSEQIPTSSINGLETTLNNKAEAADISNLANEFATHRDDNTRHKTPEEQAKLGNLADNANTTYATKEEISILQSNGAIVIPYDFTKTVSERKAEAIQVSAEYFEKFGNYVGKPLYILFKWFDASNDPTKFFTRLVMCEQKNLYYAGIASVEALLSVPILTQDDILKGITTPKYQVVNFMFTPLNPPASFSEKAFTSLIHTKSFNLFFFPEGKSPENWPEFCTANAGKEVSGTLTRYVNEASVPCDSWDDMWAFAADIVSGMNENRMPPIYLRTITSGTKDLLKPAIIEQIGVKSGITNRFAGLNLRTSSIEEINGERCFVEETLNLSPRFSGYNSRYTYKFTITPCKPRVEVVTEYPTDLSRVADGTIFIKNPVV